MKKVVRSIARFFKHLWHRIVAEEAVLVADLKAEAEVDIAELEAEIKLLETKILVLKKYI
jgi:hypothetical protein